MSGNKKMILTFCECDNSSRSSKLMDDGLDDD